MNKNSWDQKAASGLRIGKFDTWKNYNHYFVRNYRKLIDQALRLLTESPLDENIKILKTDLWDAIVECERSVVGILPLKFRKSVFFIDIAGSLVKEGIKKFGTSRVKKSDIRDLNFKDDKFGLILDCSTIDHIPARDIRKALDEYLRVVSPGGIIVVVYARKNLPLRLVNHFSRFLFRKNFFSYLSDSRGQYFFEDDLLNKYIRDHPLARIKRRYYFGTILHLPSKNKLVKAILNLIPWIFFRLLSSLEMTPWVTTVFKPTSLFGGHMIQKQFDCGQVEQFWRKKEKKFTDDRASLWDHKVLNRFIHFEQLFILRKSLNRIKKNDRVLDVGCGTGRILEEIATRTKHAIGLDYSTHALKIAQKRLANKNLRAVLVNKNLSDYKYPTSYYDVIFSITTLSMIMDKKKYYQIVNKLIKSLRPGGELVMIERFGNQYDAHIIKTRLDGFISSVSRSMIVRETKIIDIRWLRLVYFGFQRLCWGGREKKRITSNFFILLDSLFLTFLVSLELILPNNLKTNGEYYYLRLVKKC